MSSHWENIKRAPAALLRPYITEYSFRRVRVLTGQTLTQTMPVWCQTTIDFFFGENIITVDDETGKIIPFAKCLFRGIRTHTKNHLEIKGDFTVFLIRFTPVGFYRLLGVPAYLFTDQVIDGTLIDKQLFLEITERLSPCTNIESCVVVVEPYLLNLAYRAERNIRASEPVGKMIQFMSASKVPDSVSFLQNKVGLSQRQLERNFIKEIGTTPKHYSRMLRFTNMLYKKMQDSNSKWSSIAYDFNYTDQMHLIHDFKCFLGVTPTRFDTENYAGFEDTPF